MKEVFQLNCTTAHVFVVNMQSQLDDWKLKMARMKAEHDRQDAERAEAERELRAKADAEAYLTRRRGISATGSCCYARIVRCGRSAYGGGAR